MTLSSTYVCPGGLCVYSGDVSVQIFCLILLTDLFLITKC